ncbi:hypothetical protein BZA05DRAFT_415232 [Tricharina praecox]|uniref:uncharacterized protein n=1 Tax=Tricharina praecox TaxID=43433 RepID=UPI00221F5D96|nr:uncharacterized protein BZA05DRAFT_415232 [Tricharina praecox]KAI5857846.1 hypothetical protein BZA05DRAFT_415232 [Tricharina praecox]
MATINPTPWESARRPSVGPSGQTLPSIGNLAGLNGSSPADGSRDSGNWSLTSSQRTSNISEVTLPPIDAHTRNSPGEQHNSNPLYSQTSPASAAFGASTTSLHSTHTTPPGNNHYHPHNGELPTPSPSASRRSSFDSRLGNLQLSSPVNGTPAASQISLNSTLLNSNRDSLTSQMQRERGIQSNSPCQPPQHLSHDSSSQHPPHNPYSMHSGRSGVPRTAPPIVGSSRYPYGQASHPNAPSPTKGLPWAFPDPEIIEPGRPSDTATARTSTSSLAGSTASSIYGGSGLVTPHVQHQMPPMMGMNGSMGGNSLPHIGAATHHHGLTSRRSSIIGESQQQTTPYSRTPELRVSHKLAERKRRKEMKDLFDELRESLPAERGGKSSKWEVLTKAIEFVNHQKDVIQDKTRQIDDMRNQMQRQQKELEAARAEVHQIRGMQQCSPSYHSHAPQHSHDGGYHPQQQQPNGNDGGYHGQSNHGNGPVKMQGLESC